MAWWLEVITDNRWSPIFTHQLPGMTQGWVLELTIVLMLLFWSYYIVAEWSFYDIPHLVRESNLYVYIPKIIFYKNPLPLWPLHPSFLASSLSTASTLWSPPPHMPPRSRRTADRAADPISLTWYKHNHHHHHHHHHDHCWPSWRAPPPRTPSARRARSTPGSRRRSQCQCSPLLLNTQLHYDKPIYCNCPQPSLSCVLSWWRRKVSVWTYFSAYWPYSTAVVWTPCQHGSTWLVPSMCSKMALPPSESCRPRSPLFGGRSRNSGTRH